MRERVPELLEFAEGVWHDGLADVVVCGMGGSSLAPEVIRRTFGAEHLHVLDTTHPAAIRALEASLDLDRTLFVVSSKSGRTLETLSHLEYFWTQVDGRRPVRGDHRPGLGARADRHASAASGPSAPASRRSAAATRRSRSSASSRPCSPASTSSGSSSGQLEMVEACRLDEGNPGLELGERLGRGWQEGRDKLAFPNPDGFGLWVEQLIAESTGKNGRGIVPGAWRAGARRRTFSTRRFESPIPTSSARSSTAGSSRRLSPAR